MSDTSSSKKKPLWRSPVVYIAIILSCLFLGFFYLAITNEPDYMPSQDAKSMQHMNHSGSSDTTAATASEPSAAEMNMSDEEHAAMPQTEHDQAHASSEVHTH